MAIFEQDILKGLTAPQKYLPSKYFYDDKGSRIFQEIMQMPEYYLTNCEYGILRGQAPNISESLCFRTPFRIVELGAGDGKKTKALLQHLTNLPVDFIYHPIDISPEALTGLKQHLQADLPNLIIEPFAGDYFEILTHLDLNGQSALFLFLGANIGNYEPAKALSLLQFIGTYMRKKDKLLLGFDLVKNPFTILKAYNDPRGITRRFNLNLLTRINRELGADFNLNQFEFYTHYDPSRGEVRSFLVSLVEQTVCMNAIRQRISFKKNELIATELSKKYTLKEIEIIASDTGFVLHRHFFDSKIYFCDSLFEKK